MIDQAQLAIDITNTEKEAQAYKQIGEGFHVLAELPETTVSDKPLYRYQSRRFRALYLECSQFLAELKGLQNESSTDAI